jgi:cytosine/creatinine deaminase
MSAFTAPNFAEPRCLIAARLPAWCRPVGHTLSDLWLNAGRVERVTAHDTAATSIAITDLAWHLQGAPLLPGLIEPHAHLDKAYTVHRSPPQGPGLLAAIEASHADEIHWSADDLRARAERALRDSLAAGVRLLRTHVSWFAPEAPRAWSVYRELRADWAGRVELECVNISPLQLFADADAAERIARQVAATPGGVLGGFVHTSNFDEAALRHLLTAAARHALRVDLHVDEELDPRACGVASTARIVSELGLHDRVACSHACALAVQDETTALRTLDAVAAAGLSFISLPSTNLLLQDARTGRTPRAAH